MSDISSPSGSEFRKVYSWNLCREFVPWEFVLVAVDGYPGLQPEDVLPIIGGSEGLNLTGAHVHKHRNTAPGQDEAPYNYVTWETNLKM